jgi:NTE family protein
MHLNANNSPPRVPVKLGSPRSASAGTIWGMQVGLSLGSGGAKGYAHIGVIRALEEAGVRIDLINGSSIGSIVGGAYALYRDVNVIVELVERLVRTMNVDFFNLFRYEGGRHSYLQNWLLNAFCDLSVLRESVLSNRTNERALSFLFEDHTFADTKIPFGAVACDLLAGESVIIEAGGLADGILPSIAIPGIFPPIARDGRLLVDGGVLAEVPVRQLRERGATFVIASRLHPDVPPPCHSGFALLTLTDGLKERRLCEWTLEEVDAVIDVALPGIDASRFDSYKRAIEMGYDAARAAMPRLLVTLEAADA